jgi:membrane-bound ClpP family serine protease
VAAGVAIYMAYRVSPFLGFVFGVVVMAMTPVVFYWAIKIYPKTPLGKRIMLSGPEPKSAGFARESARLAELVGKRGVAMTLLRPAGSIELDGRRIDAVSESEIIEPNTPVEVIRVNGLKVIVKAISG